MSFESQFTIPYVSRHAIVRYRERVAPILGLHQSAVEILECLLYPLFKCKVNNKVECWGCRNVRGVRFNIIVNKEFAIVTIGNPWHWERETRNAWLETGYDPKPDGIQD